MPNFTLSPWTIIEGPGHDGAMRFRVVAGKFPIADILPSEQKADNAALIHASPDMFKALEDMLVDAQFHNVWPADHFCVRQAQAALSKAVKLP